MQPSIHPRQLHPTDTKDQATLTRESDSCPNDSSIHPRGPPWTKTITLNVSMEPTPKISTSGNIRDIRGRRKIFVPGDSQTRLKYFHPYGQHPHTTDLVMALTNFRPHCFALQPCWTRGRGCRICSLCGGVWGDEATSDWLPIAEEKRWVTT